MSTSSRDFYQDLPALTQFIDLANPSNYQDAPDDWYVLVTDIAGSTQAIIDGKYKEVNLLGASSIIAVLNATRHLEIPFVFGGDGASLLVPPECLPAGRKALLGMRDIARASFEMELRVGAVPVETVKAEYSLKVAKFRLTPTYCQASFMGGGVTYAADLLKANTLYQFVTDGTCSADLKGMECRWQEIPSTQGQTVSLIVAATASSGQSNDDVYSQVLNTITQIYGENYHPIAKSSLQLTFNVRKLLAEVKARAASTSFWSRLQYLLKILLENLLGVILMRFQLKMGGVDWGKYKDDVRMASDYQKIDDILRMVIASNPTRTEKLTGYLEQCFRAGLLTYGIHVSDRALLTCMILDRRDRHFHLVDGADGGYALAAKGLKAQLRHKADNWKTYAKIAKHRQTANELTDER